MQDKSFFNAKYYIERNKKIAAEKYGGLLDKDRNIQGTNFYFDHCWRLCNKK